jgi:hypothetical protein
MRYTPPGGLSRRSDMAKLTTSVKTYPTKPYSQYLTFASITQRLPHDLAESRDRQYIEEDLYQKQYRFRAFG